MNDKIELHTEDHAYLVLDTDPIPESQEAAITPVSQENPEPVAAASSMVTTESEPPAVAKDHDEWISGRSAVIYILSISTISRDNLAPLIEGIIHTLRAQASVIDIKKIVVVVNPDETPRDQISEIRHQNANLITWSQVPKHPTFPMTDLLHIGTDEYPESKKKLFPHHFSAYADFTVDPNDVIAIVEHPTRMEPIRSAFETGVWGDYWKNLWLIENDCSRQKPLGKFDRYNITASRIIRTSRQRASLIMHLNELLRTRTDAPLSTIEQAIYLGDMEAYEKFLPAPLPEILTAAQESALEMMTNLELAVRMRRTELVHRILKDEPRVKMTPYLQLLLNPAAFQMKDFEAQRKSRATALLENMLKELEKLGHEQALPQDLGFYLRSDTVKPPKILKPTTHVAFDWQNIHVSLSHVNEFVDSFFKLAELFNRADNMVMSVFLDTQRLPEVTNICKSRGVLIHHIDGLKHRAADSQITDHLLKNFKIGDSIILSSGDRDFSAYLSSLFQKGCSIILVHNHQAWLSLKNNPQWMGALDYVDLPKLEKVKEILDQRGKLKNSASAAKGKKSTDRSKACNFYQDGTCRFLRSPQMCSFQHICGRCQEYTKTSAPHPAQECLRPPSLLDIQPLDIPFTKITDPLLMIQDGGRFIVNIDIKDWARVTYAHELLNEIGFDPTKIEDETIDLNSIVSVINSQFRFKSSKNIAIFTTGRKIASTDGIEKFIKLFSDLMPPLAVIGPEEIKEESAPRNMEGPPKRTIHSIETYLNCMAACNNAAIHWMVHLKNYVRAKVYFDIALACAFVVHQITYEQTQYDALLKMASIVRKPVPREVTQKSLEECIAPLPGNENLLGLETRYIKDTGIISKRNLIEDRVEKGRNRVLPFLNDPYRFYDNEHFISALKFNYQLLAGLIVSCLELDITAAKWIPRIHDLHKSAAEFKIDIDRRLAHIQKFPNPDSLYRTTLDEILAPHELPQLTASMRTALARQHVQYKKDKAIVETTGQVSADPNAPPNPLDNFVTRGTSKKARARQRKALEKQMIAQAETEKLVRDHVEFPGSPPTHENRLDTPTDPRACPMCITRPRYQEGQKLLPFCGRDCLNKYAVHIYPNCLHCNVHPRARQTLPTVKDHLFCSATCAKHHALIPDPLTNQALGAAPPSDNESTSEELQDTEALFPPPIVSSGPVESVVSSAPRVPYATNGNGSGPSPSPMAGAQYPNYNQYPTPERNIPHYGQASGPNRLPGVNPQPLHPAVSSAPSLFPTSRVVPYATNGNDSGPGPSLMTGAQYPGYNQYPTPERNTPHYGQASGPYRIPAASPQLFHPAQASGPFFMNPQVSYYAQANGSPLIPAVSAQPSRYAPPPNVRLTASAHKSNVFVPSAQNFSAAANSFVPQATPQSFFYDNARASAQRDELRSASLIKVQRTNAQASLGGDHLREVDETEILIGRLCSLGPFLAQFADLFRENRVTQDIINSVREPDDIEFFLTLDPEAAVKLALAKKMIFRLLCKKTLDLFVTPVAGFTPANIVDLITQKVPLAKSLVKTITENYIDGQLLLKMEEKEWDLLNPGNRFLHMQLGALKSVIDKLPQETLSESAAGSFTM